MSNDRFSIFTTQCWIARPCPSMPNRRPCMQVASVSPCMQVTLPPPLLLSPLERRLTLLPSECKDAPARSRTAGAAGERSSSYQQLSCSQEPLSLQNRAQCISFVWQQHHENPKYHFTQSVRLSAPRVLAALLHMLYQRARMRVIGSEMEEADAVHYWFVCQAGAWVEYKDKCEYKYAWKWYREKKLNRKYRSHHPNQQSWMLYRERIGCAIRRSEIGLLTMAVYNPRWNLHQQYKKICKSKRNKSNAIVRWCIATCCLPRFAKAMGSEVRRSRRTLWNLPNSVLWCSAW